MRPRPTRSRSGRRNPVNFEYVNAVALSALPSLVKRWLPGGRIEGCEYIALNPRRTDRHFGSFRINMVSGRWADFAVADARGGDVTSLAAYLGGTGQAEAAEKLAAMLGIDARNAR
jgi:hypothetical protein